MGASPSLPTGDNRHKYPAVPSPLSAQAHALVNLEGQNTKLDSRHSIDHILNPEALAPRSRNANGRTISPHSPRNVEDEQALSSFTVTSHGPVLKKRILDIPGQGIGPARSNHTDQYSGASTIVYNRFQDIRLPLAVPSYTSNRSNQYASQVPSIAAHHISAPYTDLVAIHAPSQLSLKELQVTGCSIYTCVAHHQSRSLIGYGIYSGPGSAINEAGCSLNDKSVYRTELRAIARALQKITVELTQAHKQPLSPGYEPKIHWQIHTCHEYAVKRVAGPTGPESAEVSHTRGAPCMDLVLHIRSLIMLLQAKGQKVSIMLTSRNAPQTRAALELAQEGALSRGKCGSDASLFMPASLKIESNMDPDSFQRVYTDGSTFLRDGDTTAGYGVYFGAYDTRNECGPVLGKGTGPRASLAAMLRAILAISKHHSGHKKWEIISCRGQYITSIFELSSEWQRHGWKRNAGKPIASLDIYREARRLLDELANKGFEIRGKYISQKIHDHGLMVADVMARNGAGDSSIELPIMPSGAFEVPAAPEDKIPVSVHTSAAWVSGDSSSLVRWEVNLGERNPSNASGYSEGSTLEKAAVYAITHVLRAIESEKERRWIVYTNNVVALRIFRERTKNNCDQQLRATIDTAITILSRLEKHGYELIFRGSDGQNSLPFVHS